MKYSDWKKLSEESFITERLRGKTVAFTFGRFQPPTSGHQKLVDALSSAAKANGAEAFLYPSRSHDPSRNPLSPEAKVKWLRKFFGNSVKVVDDASARTIFDVLSKFEKEGVKKVILVVGGERVPEFKKTIKPYLSTKNKKNTYNFEFSVVSAGERDPDAEGVVGMSASKMRAAATNNDFKAFMGGMSQNATKRDAEALFKELRKSMSLKENTEFSTNSLVEVGNYQKMNGRTIQFWLDESENVVFAVEIDEEGNTFDGGYGSIETMLSLYPDAWKVLRPQLQLAVISRRAKHRKTEDTYEETNLLKPWMLRLQSLKESGWAVIAATQYMMRTRCADRVLPMIALNNSTVIRDAYNALKQQYDSRKKFESPDDSSWTKRKNQMFYTFFDLFTKAMKSKKESDWKQAQRYVCSNENDLLLPSEVKAMLTAGPLGV